jgi:hypothetical protein
MIALTAGAVPTAHKEAVSIGLAVEANRGIWTAKLKTGPVATFRVNVSRAFRAAALIALVAAAASAVIASVAVVDLAAVASVVLAEAAEEDFAAAAASEVDDKNVLNQPPIFS